MDKNLNPIKGRLIQYIEYKGVSREKFFSSVGLSLANFKGKALESSLSTDSLVKILNLNKDLNSDWLLLEEGNMLKESIPLDKKDIPLDRFYQQDQVAEEQAQYNNNQTSKINSLIEVITQKDLLIQDLRYTIQLQKELIETSRNVFQSQPMAQKQG